MARKVSKFEFLQNRLYKIFNIHIHAHTVFLTNRKKIRKQYTSTTNIRIKRHHQHHIRPTTTSNLPIHLLLLVPLYKQQVGFSRSVSTALVTYCIKWLKFVWIRIENVRREWNRESVPVYIPARISANCNDVAQLGPKIYHVVYQQPHTHTYTQECCFVHGKERKRRNMYLLLCARLT